MDVRQFQPDDLTKLLQFVARHYPECAAKADESYFHWRFRDNPLGSALDSYWLVWEEDEIVGQLGGIRDRIYAGNHWHDALWLVDLMIAPERRGQLGALRLFQALMNQQLLLLTVGAGPQMQRIYESLGWQQRRIAETFYLPIRPSRLFNLAVDSGRVSSSQGIRRPLMALADSVFPSLHAMLGPGRNKTHSRVEVSPLESFESEIDELADEVLPSLGITPHRSAKQLQWKFNCRPSGQHKAWAVRENARGSAIGKLRGYLVMKQMQRPGIARWGEVVDYLLPSAEVHIFRALVATACHQALNERLDFVRFRLSHTEHQRQLNGPWWRVHTAPVSDDVFVHAADPHLANLLTSDPWHLTSLVSDRADYGRDDWAGIPEKAAETPASRHRNEEFA